VLNSNANVTEANGVISIAGFGTFAIPTVAAAEEDRISVAKNAVAGVYTITPVTPYDDTKTYDIVLGIRSERVLSNIFSDIDVWTPI
jgi:hypothetical protein